jgi:hypothetical protein
VHPGSEKAENHGGGISRGLSYAAGLALLALMLPVALKGRSDTLDGVRHWWLADDAMISMRYGRNLAEGLGLVWNAAGSRRSRPCRQTTLGAMSDRTPVAIRLSSMIFRWASALHSGMLQPNGSPPLTRQGP